MTPYVLGLDLGVSSVGWCIASHIGEDQLDGQVIAMGSIISRSTLEDKTAKPKNLKRRTMRGMRNTLRRRRMRRDTLTSLLREANLLPEASEAWNDLFSDHAKNPYILRQRGLDHELEPFEFGRVLYHINRRRGFKSNRRTQLVALEQDPEVAALIAEEERAKAETAAKGKSKGGEAKSDVEDQEGAVLKEISQLRTEMAATGSRTLGEHFAKILAATDESGHRTWESVRRRHTDRAMYEEEFESLWEAQARFHPKILTPGLKARVHEAIFHQRPLKIRRSTVGKCRFEPDRQRCNRAHPDAQDYRIWQDLTHTTYRLPNDREDRPLDQTQREAVAAALRTTAKMSWTGFKKAAGLPRAAKLNMEDRSGHTELTGNTTVIRIEKAAPGLWDRLDQTERDQLITDLFTIYRKDSLVRRLRKRSNLPIETAYRLAVTEFDEGVAGLSLQAIRNMLPHLKQGMNYHDAVMAAAKRFREQGRRQKADLYLHVYEREFETVEVLPFDKRLDARNPVVNKCLHETRKLVNAIVRENGKPAVIRIEMARDMKLNKKDKRAIEDANKRNEKLNKEAEEAFRKLRGGEASREDKVKYRLWKECDERCPYTGTKISLEMLYSGQVDIEHIVPYSQCLDDSMANKTLCMADENRMHKRNQAPYQAYAGTAQYEEILQRVAEMKCGRHKRKLFRLTDDEINELYGDFSKRHLNDTRHICRLVKDYLKLLGCEVQVSKGGATAALRHKWGLETILAPAGDGGKNRDDHRHHAIDAAVVAYTSPAYLKRLSEANAKLERDEDTGKRDQLRHAQFYAPPPYAGFRADIARLVEGIVVSHEANRGLAGALHDETAYGWDQKAGRFTVRKPVLSLTANEIEGIRDAKLKERVKAFRAERDAAFAEHSERKKQQRDQNEGGETLGKFVEPELCYKDKYGRTRVVRRVKVNTRLGNPDKMLEVQSVPSPALGQKADPRAVKSFAFGSNHHFVLYEDTLSGRRAVEVVTMYEAAQRAVRGKPIFDPKPEHERYVPIMALCAGDIVRTAGMAQELYIVVRFSVENPIDLTLRPLNCAVPGEGDVRLRTSKSLEDIVERVLVDRLGNVRKTRDRY